MPEIPNLPPDLWGEPGVSMTPPPPSTIVQTNNMIRDAVSAIGQGKSGSLTVWINTTEGVNAAFVQKAGGHINIVAYAGKKWGQPLSAGVAGLVEW